MFKVTATLQALIDDSAVPQQLRLRMINPQRAMLFIIMLILTPPTWRIATVLKFRDLVCPQDPSQERWHRPLGSPPRRDWNMSASLEFDTQWDVLNHFKMSSVAFFDYFHSSSWLILPYRWCILHSFQLADNQQQWLSLTMSGFHLKCSILEKRRNLFSIFSAPPITSSQWALVSWTWSTGNMHLRNTYIPLANYSSATYCNCSEIATWLWASNCCHWLSVEDLLNYKILYAVTEFSERWEPID